MFERRSHAGERSGARGAQGADDRALLEHIRELRSTEHAPEALRQLVLQRLARESGVAPALGVDRHERLSRSLSLRLVAAALLGGVVALAVVLGRRGADVVVPEISFAAEPSLLATRPAPAVSIAPEFMPMHLPYFEVTTSAIARGRGVAEREHNLITNGDFARGDALWSVKLWQDLRSRPRRRASYSVMSGALCTTVRAGQHVLGGWPWEPSSPSTSSFELVAGRAYRLSLKASASGPLPIQLLVKVAHRTLPHTPVVVASVAVGTRAQLFTVDFTPADTDDDVGFGFAVSGAAGSAQSEVCLDDISLTEG